MHYYCFFAAHDDIFCDVFLSSPSLPSLLRRPGLRSAFVPRLSSSPSWFSCVSLLCVCVCLLSSSVRLVPPFPLLQLYFTTIYIILIIPYFIVAGRDTQRIRCPRSWATGLPNAPGACDLGRPGHPTHPAATCFSIQINLGTGIVSLPFMSCHAVHRAWVRVVCVRGAEGLGVGGLPPPTQSARLSSPIFGRTERSGGRRSVIHATKLDSHGCVTENN